MTKQQRAKYLLEGKTCGVCDHDFCSLDHKDVRDTHTCEKWFSYMDTIGDFPHIPEHVMKRFKELDREALQKTGDLL